MTALVDEGDVVIGKFLGSFLFFLVLLAPTLLYIVMLAIFGDPDYGPIFSGYLGLVLSALFVAIGLFCSSLTRSQVVAAVAAAAILFLVTVVPWFAAGEAALTGLWRSSPTRA